MKYLLKALTTNNRDLKTSVVFAIRDPYHKMYLFSCPDGFQRVADLQKLKFQKVSFVFLPSLQPDHFAGFPGLFLSARGCLMTDIKQQEQMKITLVGPKGTVETMQKTMSFTGQYSENLDIMEIPQDLKAIKQDSEQQMFNFMPETSRVAFQDEIVTIYPMKATSMSSTTEQTCFSYIGVPQQSQPVFLPQKARQLGCQPLKHYKPLSKGYNVTLDDGTVVTPGQVLEEQEPSRAFMVIFLPNESYIKTFIDENQSLFNHFMQSHEKYQTSVIYHSMPMSCLMNPLYREQFMMKFKHAIHVLDCPESNKQEYSRQRAFALSHMIKQICPLLLPVSVQDVKDYTLENRTILEQSLHEFKVVQSQLGLVLEMFPKLAVDQRSVIKMGSEDAINTEHSRRQEIKLVSDGLKRMLLDKATNTLIDNSAQRDVFEDSEPQLLFLGTSSMKPCNYRGASAIYYFCPENKGAVLMDSAEGSYGQIFDHFGTKDKVDQVLLKTRVIFITHIHGDHQLGVIKMMLERDLLQRELPEEQRTTLFIVTPSPMLDWMLQYRDQLELPELTQIVISSDLNPEENYYYQHVEVNYFSGIVRDTSKPNVQKCEKKTPKEMKARIENFDPKTKEAQEMFKVCRSMGLRKVIAVEVDHCPQSYACLLLSENGDKIVYSGDTLPCQNLINYAANCKVLIHEATFEDGLEQDALFKKHTTTGQAIEVGRKVKAWRTILTHFSPRYQKIAEISQKHLDNKCLVAFDHMRIRLSHLEWAYHITGLYSKLLSNDDIGQKE